MGPDTVCPPQSESSHFQTLKRILIVAPFVTHPSGSGPVTRLLGMESTLRDARYEVHYAYLTAQGEPGKAMISHWQNRLHVLPYRHPSVSGSAAQRWHARIRKWLPNGNYPLKQNCELDDWFDFGTRERWDVILRETSPDAVICTYVYLSKYLEWTPLPILKILDTHDRFANRFRVASASGMKNDWFSTSLAGEIRGFRRADRILAISSDDRDSIRQAGFANVREVAPVIQQPANSGQYAGAPTLKTIGFIGNKNAANTAGIQWFIDAVWPDIIHRVPNAKLLIAGSVFDPSRIVPEGVQVLGKIDETASFYSDCTVTINPVVSGTGIPIKCLESLAHGRPVVASPSGARGLERFESRGLSLADVPSEWVDSLSRLMEHPLKEMDIHAAVEEWNAHHSENLLQSLKPDSIQPMTKSGSSSVLLVHGSDLFFGSGTAVMYRNLLSLLPDTFSIHQFVGSWRSSPVPDLEHRYRIETRIQPHFAGALKARHYYARILDRIFHRTDWETPARWDAKRLIRHIRQHRPDIVWWSGDYLPWSLALFESVLPELPSDTRFILSLYDPPGFWKSARKPLIPALRIALLRADAIDVIGSNMAGLIRETLPTCPTPVILNDIARPTPLRSPAKRGAFTVVIAGQIYDPAGLQLLVDKLGTDNTPIHVEWYGTENNLRTAQAIRWPETVKLLKMGPVERSEIPERIAQADAGFLSLPDEPSDFARYSVPTKLITYLEAGLPILYVAPDFAETHQMVQKYSLGFRIDKDIHFPTIVSSLQETRESLQRNGSQLLYERCHPETARQRLICHLTGENKPDPST